jgi:hypothetical protein
MNEPEKITTPVRFSHLTSYAGVGGIVQTAEDLSVVMPDIRSWVGATEIMAVKRVCCALGISGKELHMPPIFTNFHKLTLDAYLFPTFAICNKCNTLHPNPWKNREKDYDDKKIECKAEKYFDKESNKIVQASNEKEKRCNGYLSQVTWCVASRKGFLADVSWHEQAHRSKDATSDQRNCKPDFENSYLYLHKDQVRCLRCNASSEFKQWQLIKMQKEQPWLTTAPEPFIHPDDAGRIYEINDERVHIPFKQEALVIPPESRIGKRSVVDRLYANKSKLAQIEAARVPLRRRGLLKSIANDFHCTLEEVNDALKLIDDGYPNINESDFENRDPVHDEYNAILKIENYDISEDFVTTHKTEQLKEIKHSSTPLKSIKKIISNHVVVNRLRVISVFKGFRRVESAPPNPDSKDASSELENFVHPDLLGESDWYPAIELFGEGVFFSFDEKILNLWEAQPSVINRAKEMSNRYELSGLSGGPLEITPRFILLHTLSHLIIRELEISSGFPAASLEERIFSNVEKQMAGVLIYTAVADMVGSLGGIIQSAEPQEFLKILLNAFNQSEWCSLDPVCSEHSGQGLHKLNGAACHACALTPERSCRFKNILLDRTFIKGSQKLEIPSFLDFINDHE